MRSRLGLPEPFVPENMALSECAQLAMAHGGIGTLAYAGHIDITYWYWSTLAEILARLHRVPERYRLPLAVDRPTIVGLELVDDAEVGVRPRLHEVIPARDGECEGALGGDEALGMRAPIDEMA